MILGITGGIGSGKSTVSTILTLLGIPVYIADVESKKLTESSPIIRQKLIDAFGSELYTGAILNKQLFASIIFSDKSKLALANSIIHPEVGNDFERWCNEHKQHPIIAKEAAILFETGMNKFIDKMVMVYTPLEMRIDRVMLRDKTTKEKVLDRINNQMSDEEKAKLSDFVINNDGATSLIQQVEDMLQKLKTNGI